MKGHQKTASTTGGTATRYVSESCYSFLVMEMVSHFGRQDLKLPVDDNNNNNSNSGKQKKKTKGEQPKEEKTESKFTPTRSMDKVSIEIEKKRDPKEILESLDDDLSLDYLQGQIAKSFGEEKVLFQMGMSTGKRFSERLVQIFHYSYFFEKEEKKFFPPHSAVSRHSHLLSQTQRFLNEQEIIKFIRDDFWPEVFKNSVQAGVPKTGNRKGIYLLRDTAFKPLARFSLGSHQDTISNSEKFLLFYCGLLKGALTNLGLESNISADIQSLPICTFRVEIM